LAYSADEVEEFVVSADRVRRVMLQAILGDEPRIGAHRLRSTA
jgi:hypothetical protein